jgi:surface antigen
MRQVPVLETFVLTAATTVMLMALVFPSGNLAYADGPSGEGTACTCPPDTARKSARPKFAELDRRTLDDTDEIAALESIQVGLSRMDDGSPFVWKRANGRLSGIVRPTSSFRNAKGSLCRHVVILLTTGYKTSTTEGVACRSANRRWVLEG